MMVRAPFERPEPPMPAMALPTINISEEFATPHRRDPSSKSPRKKRKVYWNPVSFCHDGGKVRVTLELKYVYNLPVSGCREQL